MTPERFQEIRDLFEQVLEQPPEQRTAFLGKACGEDHELLMEVQRMLIADALPESPIDRPAVAAVGPTITPDLSNNLEGLRIGPYLIQERIGSGGMGVVYRATRVDKAFSKEVAFKVIRPGMGSPEIAQRFQQEREILASLDHPHIARLLDGGSTPDGLAYFVMEYVEGTPIHQYCDENKLNITARLKLFQYVCEAIQYAHQNLVVHRDLKPGNILVTKAGIVKLLDFGIAKLLRSTGDGITACMTRQGLLVMTPEYASPEQIKGEAITTASDTYTLGVVLYELLTGHRPYHLKSRVLYEIAKVVCEEEPTPPSSVVSETEEGAGKDQDPPRITPEQVSQVREGKPERLKRRLSGDLDHILLHALRKEPQWRYRSIEEFKEDLRRHLDGLPVMAQRDTLRYRAGKFVRRHRGGVLVATTTLLVLVCAVVVSTVLYIEAQSARKQAESQSYEANLSAADLDLRTNKIAEARRRLLMCPRDLRGWEWQHLILKSDSSIATLYTLGDSDYKSLPISFAFSADGKRIFSSTQHTLYSWDAATFLPAGRWSSFGSIVAIGPHAERIVSKTYTSLMDTSISGDLMDRETDYKLRILDPVSHRLIATLEGHKYPVNAAAFSSDGARLVTGDTGGNLLLWDVETGRILSGPIRGSTIFSPDRRHRWWPLVVAVAFRRDGKRVAAAFADENCATEAGAGVRGDWSRSGGTVRLWDETLHEVGPTLAYPCYKNQRRGVIAFSPDGEQLAAAYGRSMRLWDAASGRRLLALDDFDSSIGSIAYTPDGSSILAGTSEGLVQIRDARSGTATTLGANEFPVQGIAFHPSGYILTAAGPRIRVWDPSSSGGARTLVGRASANNGPIALSPNGRFLVSSEDSVIRVWETSSGKSLWTAKADTGFIKIAFSPDSIHFASASEIGDRISIWDVISGRALKFIECDHFRGMAFSPDGRRLAVLENNEIRLWDVGTGKPSARVVLRADLMFTLAYSQDGRRMAIHDYWSRDDSPDLSQAPVRVYDSESGKLIASTAPESDFSEVVGFLDVACNRDGTRIAGVDGSRTWAIWDANSGKQLVPLKGPNVRFEPTEWLSDMRGMQGVSGLAIFHPNGRRFFAAWGNLVYIWDARTGAPLLSLTAHHQQIRSIALTADGTRLATASRDGIIKIWDTRSAYNAEVESLVQSLYQKLNFATDVIEELRSSPSVDESIRGPALLLVQQQGERDPVGHIRASWQIVKAGGARRDACELALRHARVACELTPWNWETFNAQGAAQYRLGAYRAALASFLRAAEVRARPSISNLALQTLAYEGLAEKTKARSKLEELERLLPRSWDVDGDLRALVQEARSAVERASR